MTLIIMLILAGISLSGLIGEKGIFQKTEKASNIYNEKKAREVLETVLLSDGQFEKQTNPEYNEEEFLNKLIKDEIPGSNVRGDVAIIRGEYAYDLDRSVPKIGIRGNNGYLGNPKDLIWPDIDATVTLAEDKKDATITITASEEKNEINKIEIWLLGEKIKEYTYDPSKPEVTENYIATQNGKYTIKAYGELMDSKTVEVDGIVASVKFDPNGDDTWKKSHSTIVTIQETADKVVNSKYYWSNSVTTPGDSKFPEDQTFKSGDTITKNSDTGTYYLWTRLETQSGEILKWRSEGFNFDNQGPTVTNFITTKYSETGITLSVTAQDNESGIVKIEIYIDNETEERAAETYNAITSSVTLNKTITGITTGSHICKVITYDNLGNKKVETKQGTTLLYTWEMYAYTPAQHKWTPSGGSNTSNNVRQFYWTGYSSTIYRTMPGINSSTGALTWNSARSFSSAEELISIVKSWGTWYEKWGSGQVMKYVYKSHETKSDGVYMIQDRVEYDHSITTETIGNLKGTIQSTSSNTYPTNGAVGNTFYKKVASK